MVIYVFIEIIPVEKVFNYQLNFPFMSHKTRDKRITFLRKQWELEFVFFILWD